MLVVVVPGLRPQIDRWQALGAALQERDVFRDYASVDWRIFDHGISARSWTRLDSKARGLNAWIDSVRDETRHHDIILVGHSAGGAIARQAWLYSVNPRQGPAFAQSAWGSHVQRFVLFAGLSRGFDSEANFLRRLVARLVAAIPGRLTVEDCVRGSAFLTNLRISWLRTLGQLEPARRPAVVQLLGTSDELVAQEDSQDVAVFPNALQIEISGANHGNLHHLDTPDRDLRLNQYVKAFTVAPCRDVEPGAGATELLMIVHGIRASSNDDWVKRAKQRAQQMRPGLEVVAPSYGYLSAFRFALPNARRRFSRYFRDFYTELLCEFPTAQPNVLCHSNGTYLLGRSLKDFDAIRVGRVALAGSVLPRDFGWGKLINDRRVLAVRSDGGELDWPVGLLCSGLRGLLMRDVGTGGFAGFLDDDVKDVRFHPGGHGAMLTNDNLDSMLGFVLAGEQPPVLSASPNRLGWLSRLMPYLMPFAAAALVVALVVGIVWAFSVGAWGWLIVFLLLPPLIYLTLETL